MEIKNQKFIKAWNVLGGILCFLMNFTLASLLSNWIFLGDEPNIALFPIFFLAFLVLPLYFFRSKENSRASARVAYWLGWPIVTLPILVLFFTAGGGWGFFGVIASPFITFLILRFLEKRILFYPPQLISNP